MSETDEQWFFAEAGQQRGPVSRLQLQQMLASGQLSRGESVWQQGMAQWQPASAVPGLVTTPPPLTPGAMGLSPPLAYATPYGARPAQPGIADDPTMRWLLPVGRSGWAIAAGYLGLFSLLVIPAPLALIVSWIAISDLKKHPGTGGMGRAIFGLIAGGLGTLLLGVMVFGVVFRR